MPIFNIFGKASRMFYVVSGLPQACPINGICAAEAIPPIVVKMGHIPRLPQRFKSLGSPIAGSVVSISLPLTGAIFSDS